MRLALRLTILIPAIAVATFCTTFAFADEAANSEINFAQDIFPLLTSRCGDCHGADAQEGQLRLDARAGVFGGGVSGPSLVKGKAEDSILFQRIAGIGDEDRMPLDEEPLSGDEIALVKKWIDEGAQWPDGVGKDITVKRHWAYEKPARPELPKVAAKDWPRNAVDYFILARLEAEGLSPSPRADKAKLLRRVYLDLIGLPPSVEEINAFIKDDSDDAYENAVNRLLASKHYGERWARPWLDAARYADSNGYQADQYREVWPYRDWVVDAMNADMPFDQFTVEQLAGDLLPKATVQQSIATGFHRQTTCNVEAGVDPEENRVNQIIDRVNTTGTVWLGTTFECVQCHNHPYDPLTQRDYYRLFAFFNNSPLEVKHTSATTYDFYGPKLGVPLEGKVTKKERELKAKFEQARGEFEERMDDLIANQDAWEKEVLAQWKAQQKGEGDRRDPWHVVEIVEFKSSGGASHKVLADGSVLISGARPDTDTYTLVATTDLTKITAFKLEALTDPSLPGGGPGRHHPERPNFVLHEFAVKASPLAASQAQPISLNSAWADYSQPQFKIEGAIDGNPNTGWAIHQEFHKPHVATFRTDGPAGYEGGTRLTITMPQNHGETRTLGRFRISVCTGEPPAEESPPEARIPDRIVEIIQTPAASRDEDLIDTLREYYLSGQTDLMKLQVELDALKRQLGEEAAATTLVMVEMDQPRETRMFRRGDFLSPADKVAPGTPATLHPLDATADTKLNRLQLAKWLVDENSPLTARVQVNRWWAEIFGRGIVRTVEDFGTQGEAPSHPQLLDWLAVELMNPQSASSFSGFRNESQSTKPWSMKHIHKLIVMSATYQQDSRITPQLLKHDPHNVLLARGPRLRMSAEMIRDNALAISGLLSRNIGGPPVFPPQPGGVWRHVGRNAPKYATDTGEDRYRRGLYVIWRRSAPYPSFVNFDAPDRAACVVSRSRANTPLQALTLLNDEAYVEMTWALARRIIAQADASASTRPTDRQRIAWAWQTAVGRAPTDSEADYLLKVYQDELARFEQNPAAVNKLIDKNPVPEGIPRQQLAAWFYVSNILLNLDETITKG